MADITDNHRIQHLCNYVNKWNQTHNAKCEEQTLRKSGGCCNPMSGDISVVILRKAPMGLEYPVKVKKWYEQQAYSLAWTGSCMAVLY